MTAAQPAPPHVVDLTVERVAVCGDWHGDLSWVRALAQAIRAIAPDVTTILQLGDWWMDLAESDRIFMDAGIERVYVTLGNHERWGEITPLLDAHPGEAVRVSQVTWLLPRPARLRLGGREFVSLGGAASLDEEWRYPGRDWWPDEAITDQHIADAIAGGPADVMLTHESPARTPVAEVQRVLRSNPIGFPDSALIKSAASRVRVAEVWDAVRPSLLLHGHMHVAGTGITDDGRQVTSLASNGRQGHFAILDLPTLTLETPALGPGGTPITS